MARLTCTTTVGEVKDIVTKTIGMSRSRFFDPESESEASESDASIIHEEEQRDRSRMSLIFFFILSPYFII